MNKKTIIKRLSALALSGGLLAMPSLYGAQSDDNQRTQTNQNSAERSQAQMTQREFELDNVIGATVVGANGNTIGEIDDLVFSASAESPMYAVISTDDWLDNQKAVVPFSSLSLSEPMDEGFDLLGSEMKFRLNIEEESFDELAGVEFDQGDLSGSISQSLNTFGEILDLDDQSQSVIGDDYRLASDFGEMADSGSLARQDASVENILVSMEDGGTLHFIIDDENDSTYRIPASEVEITDNNEVNLPQTGLSQYRIYSATETASATTASDREEGLSSTSGYNSERSEEYASETDSSQGDWNTRNESEDLAHQSEQGRQNWDRDDQERQSQLEHGDRDQPTVDLGDPRQASEEYADRGQGEPETSELRSEEEQDFASDNMSNQARPLEHGDQDQPTVDLGEARQASEEYADRGQGEPTESSLPTDHMDRGDRDSAAQDPSQTVERNQETVDLGDPRQSSEEFADRGQGEPHASATASEEDQWNASARQQWDGSSLRNVSDPRTIVGTEVRDRQGESVGEIRDVLMRQDNGDIAFVVVETDDWFDSNAAIIPVDSVSVQSSASQNAQQSQAAAADSQQSPEAIVLQISEEQFEQIADYEEGQDVSSYLEQNRERNASALGTQQEQIPADIVLISLSDVESAE